MHRLECFEGPETVYPPKMQRELIDFEGSWKHFPEPLNITEFARDALQFDYTKTMLLYSLQNLNFFMREGPKNT